MIRIFLIAALLFSSVVSAETIDQLCDKLKEEKCERECGKEKDTTLSPLERRLRDERGAFCDRFSIIPHRPNYILLVSYNSTPNMHDQDFYTEETDRYEVKFQFSLKTAIWPNMFGNRNLHLKFGYTQHSYWHLYSWDKSAPFRETNYEPELMLSYYTPTETARTSRLLPRVSTVGFLHQSNGQGEERSRSWNRIYANFIWEKPLPADAGYLYVGFMPWWRIEEDASNDDNPDIDEYLGYGELKFLYYLDKEILYLRDHVVAVMLRNNLREDNKGAIQVDYSFRSPLSKLKFYIQYFHGYGENLIDYNHSVSRIGAGIMLNDWL